MLYPQKNMKRTLECLDGIWETEIEGIYRDMAVPASWNEQYSELYHYFGSCRYKKKLFIAKVSENEDLWLRFGGVSTNTDVFVNGCFVGRHEGASLPFEFQIGHAVKPDMVNTIEVVVDNALDPWGLPPAELEENEGRDGFTNSYPAVTYDFFPYGGIHRSVFLYTAPKNRIEDIKIDTEISGKVLFRIKLTEKTTSILQVQIGEDRCQFTVEDRDYVAGEMQIDHPRLWDMGQPELYDMELKLFTDDTLQDSYTQSFGVREIRIQGTKLLLNNKEIFLKGFGKHEDFAVLGKGYNSALVVKDYALLKWIGANSFRTSHYPYDEQMLFEADRQGILVIDETPFVGLNARMYREDILQKAVGIIGELINRDYNHPSVVMWSLANEPNVRNEAGEHFFKVMYNCARGHDSTRPITYAAHGEPENNLGLKYYDIVCLNKYYGWYTGAGQIDETLEAFSECLERFYKNFGKGIILTEFGADAIAGIHTEPAQMFSEEYQSEIIKKQYNIARKKDYVIGTHVWAFADFKTCQSKARIVLNRKGVFTRERQPKMSAHMLRELW